MAADRWSSAWLAALAHQVELYALDTPGPLITLTDAQLADLERRITAHLAQEAYEAALRLGRARETRPAREPVQVEEKSTAGGLVPAFIRRGHKELRVRRILGHWWPTRHEAHWRVEVPGRKGPVVYELVVDYLTYEWWLIRLSD